MTDIRDALSREKPAEARPSTIAVAFYDRLDKGEAVAQTTRVVVEVPGDRATVLLGISKEEVGRLSKAVEPLLKSLRVNEDLRRTYDQLIDVQLEKEAEIQRKQNCHEDPFDRRPTPLPVGPIVGEGFVCEACGERMRTPDCKKGHGPTEVEAKAAAIRNLCDLDSVCIGSVTTICRKSAPNIKPLNNPN
ncbi:MAG: hypothetical protein L0338_28210 [Acidobacteria bacterium]|nr:hypothetical protein [Acidobacteriota bacterium]